MNESHLVDVSDEPDGTRRVLYERMPNTARQEAIRKRAEQKAGLLAEQNRIREMEAKAKLQAAEVDRRRLDTAAELAAAMREKPPETAADVREYRQRLLVLATQAGDGRLAADLLKALEAALPADTKDAGGLRAEILLGEDEP